jgi:hypothetical protein
VELKPLKENHLSKDKTNIFTCRKLAAGAASLFVSIK